MNITSVRTSPSPTSGVWFDMDIESTSGTYHALGKKFKDGSKYGINKGRVSILMITHPKGYTCLSYDRGDWYRCNFTEEEHEVLNAVVNYFDNQKN